MSAGKRGPVRYGIEERTDRAGRLSYRGTAYDRKSKRALRGPWTYSLAEARSWRVDALSRIQAGTLSGDRGPTVAAVIDEFIDGITTGTISNRSGTTYKPSAVAGYKRDLRKRVAPAFGASRLGELTLPDVQRWADTLSAEGLAPATVRNVVNSLRALYGWALPRGLARINPCSGLRLPTGEKARDRIAPPSEAASLIAALAARDQAALGLAIYAGLRLGEVLAIEWAAIDLGDLSLQVVRSWDPVARLFVTPKSGAGRRIPITRRLGTLLDDHQVLTNQAVGGLLFPGRTGHPVHPTSLRERMKKAWTTAQLDGIGFHEARHTAASTFIAAGMNAKTVTTLMGHSSIMVTFDRYGHLFPGSEVEARGLLDAYIERHTG